MKTVVFLVFFSFFGAISKSQSCYKVIADLSGVDISSYQSALSAKACQLLDSFPIEFRNDFKVLDFGFYSQSEHTTGGFKAVWDNKVVPQANLESKYYILFGKQTDQNGVFNKFWVEVKLPETGIFECFTPQHRVYITTQIKSVTETNYSVNGRLNSKYAEAEIAALDTLISIISKAKNCCIPSNGLRSNPFSCTVCPDDLDYFRNLMERFGFKKVDLGTMTVSSKNDTLSSIKEYSEINGTLDGQPFNVNIDLKTYLNKLSNKMEGIKAEIMYYNPADLKCLDIMSLIVGDDTKDFPALRNRIKSGTRSTDDDFTYSVTVIATKDENENGQVHVRVKMPEMTKSGKTIYLQTLDGCCLDEQIIRSKLINFYNLLGTHKILKPGWENVTHPPASAYQEISLVPNIQVVPYIWASQVKSNTVVLFGTTSRLIKAAQINYRDISEDWGIEGGLIDFKSSSILEKGQRGYGNISLVKETLSDYLTDFKCQTTNDLAAFLAFHATGHNADLDHLTKPLVGSVYNSYMSQGCCIVNNYLSNFSPCNACPSPGTHNFINLETFVSTTMKDDQYKHIKQAIYERFIK